MNRLAQLLELFRTRHDNALCAYFSPFAGWQRRILVSVIILMPLLLVIGLHLAGISIPAVQISLGILALPAAILLPAVALSACEGRRRTPQFVEDLFLTTMTRREVAFGLCYWPTRIVLLTMTLWMALLLVETIVGLWTLSSAISRSMLETLPWFVVLTVGLLGVSLPVTLRHWLQPSKSALGRRLGIAFEVLRAGAGWGLMTYALGIILRNTLTIRVTSADNFTIAAGVIGYGILVTFKVRSLLRFAGRRFFADIEANDAGRLLWWTSERVEDRERPYADNARRALNDRIRKSAPTLFRAALISIIPWLAMGFVIEALARNGGVPVIGDRARARLVPWEGMAVGLFSAPYVAITMLFLSVTSALMLARRAQDRTLPFVNGLLRYSAYAQWRSIAIVASFFVVTSVVMGYTSNARAFSDWDDWVFVILFYGVFVALTMYFVFVTVAVRRTRIMVAPLCYGLLMFYAYLATSSLVTGYGEAPFIPNSTVLGKSLILAFPAFSGYLLMGGLYEATQQLFEEEVRHRPRFMVNDESPRNEIGKNS